MLVAVAWLAQPASAAPPRNGFPDAFRTPSGDVVCSPSSLETRVVCWLTLGGKAGKMPEAWVLPALGRAHVTHTVRLNVLPRRVLGNGEAWADNHFTCVAHSSGVTCQQAYAPGRHGFFLSARRQRLF